MPSGGARTNSGPPPDPNALRRGTSRDTDKEWLTLPAGGRDGDTPVWPLKDQTTREATVWAAMWCKPQAVAWERFGLEWEVALFVRRMVETEVPRSSSNTATLVRQMMDSLGLTTPGMKNNRWKLSDDEVGAQRLAREPLPENKYSARNRIRKAK